MKDRIFQKYHLFSCIGMLAASLYPLWMGVRVVTDMLRNGAVYKEDYPKYIIPYTPICLAVFCRRFSDAPLHAAVPAARTGVGLGFRSRSIFYF